MFIKSAVSFLLWSCGGKTGGSCGFLCAWHSVGCCGNHHYCYSDYFSLDAWRWKAEGKVKGAGVIMIGPIPIIFGTDKKSVKSVLALALALTIALVIAMVVYYWLLR